MTLDQVKPTLVLSLTFFARVLLGAVDDDTPAGNLTFTVTPETANNRASPIGFFSHSNRPNAPTLTFTQKDIDEGKIMFTHTAG